MNPAPAIELRVSNTVDTWYGTWHGMVGSDSGCISEGILSIRLFESNLRGEFDILHTIYWDQKFRLRDTTMTHIAWKKVEFETPEISVVLGDFYSTFGQGLILGMEPNEQLQRERLIEGIKVGTKLSWFELGQIWGVPYEINRLQKNYKIVSDTSDVLFGLNVSFGLPYFSLSGRGLRLKTEDTLYTNLCGGGFEFKRNWISCYLEVAQKSGWDKIDGGEKKGWGMYSSLDIIPYGINFQFMNYDTLGIGGTEYRYNLLPALNQSGYRIDEGQRITRNGIGFQATGEKAIGDIIFSLSHSEIEDKEEKNILEYYLKAEYMDFYGLLKFLYLGGSVDPHFNERRELDGEIHGNFKNIESTFSVEKEEGVTFMDSIKSFFDVGLSIQFPILEIFTMYLDYTCRSKEVREECPGIEWYGIGMKVEPSPKIFFELWGGKEKGGLVCSGGVCRWVAPFEGFKLKLNITL